MAIFYQSISTKHTKMVGCSIKIKSRKRGETSANGRKRLKIFFQ